MNNKELNYYYYYYHRHHHHLLYNGLVPSKNKLSQLGLILFFVLFLFASYVPCKLSFVVCVFMLFCFCYGLFSC